MSTLIPLLPSRERMQELRLYLRKVMEAKGLTGLEIQQKSKGGISDSYVSQILSGKIKSISVEKCNALAQGLGVDGWEVYQAASGHKVVYQEPDPWPSRILVRVIGQIVSNPELTEIVKRLVDLKPSRLRAVKKAVQIED